MSKKKTSKKIHKSKRTQRYYGLQVLREGGKTAWLSSQNRHGWALGLALNNRTVWLRNIRFQSRKDVEAAMSKGKIVFIHLKGSPKSK